MLDESANTSARLAETNWKMSRLSDSPLFSSFLNDSYIEKSNETRSCVNKLIVLIMLIVDLNQSSFLFSSIQNFSFL